jgi:hypothetical protein
MQTLVMLLDSVTLFYVGHIPKLLSTVYPQWRLGLDFNDPWRSEGVWAGTSTGRDYPTRTPIRVCVAIEKVCQTPTPNFSNVWYQYKCRFCHKNKYILVFLTYFANLFSSYFNCRSYCAAVATSNRYVYETNISISVRLSEPSTYTQ